MPNDFNNADPFAHKYQTDQDIQNIWDRIKNNQYVFGKDDLPAIAIKQYQAVYGRNPNSEEIARALASGDINGSIANQKYMEDNTPEKLAAKQQAQYLADAPKHYDAVNQIFQSQLGRTASQDELSHFGSMLASGNTDPYQLQQFIQQQPEYQQTQNKNFQNGLSDQLAGYDKQYFSNSILPSLQEAYAKQGRSFDSSAFQNAATNSAQQQNTSRQNFLANLSAQQYGNTQSNAYNDYARQVQNQQALTNSGINAQYAGVQNSVSRSNELNDFQMQQNAYNQYLAKYGKRNNGLGGLIGTAGGALLGGFLPGGSLAGAQLGSQLGGAFGQAGQNMYGGSY